MVKLKINLFLLISIVLHIPSIKCDINIHIIPQSHIDPGWLETYQEYYKRKVGNIYNSVLNSLISNKNRTFVICEIIYFTKWYRSISFEKQIQFKSLVNKKRIEFVLGGLIMNDEANPIYNNIIDQLRYGQQFLLEEFNVIPKTGWYLDPFGHSSGNALIMSQLSYEQLVFGRIHKDYLTKLIKEKSTEFIWEPFNKVSTNKKILTHALPLHYGVSSFCKYFMDKNNVFIRGIEKYTKTLLENLKFSASGLQHSQLLFLYGEDFAFDDGDNYFANIESVIQLVESKNNSYPDYFDGKINFFYSTPQKYFDSIREEMKLKNLEFKIIHNKDFFPYSDKSTSYWSGYFTSRPYYKGYIKKASNSYYALSKYHSLNKMIESNFTYNEELIKSLDLNRKMVGLQQHHDAITGTSRARVTEDYIKMLKSSLKDLEKNTKNEIEKRLKVKISKICYNNYIVDQNNCSEEFTISEEENNGEINLGIINPSIKNNLLISIEILDSETMYIIENLQSDFFCVNSNTITNGKLFQYKNKCFLKFFYKFKENENYIYLKIKKIDENVISGTKLDLLEDKIELISNHNKIKSFYFYPKEFEFDLEYYNKNFEINKIHFTYYDGLYYAKLKDIDCKDGSYLFCPSEKYPDPIEIDKKNSFYIKGNLGIIITTRNIDSSFTIFILFYNPFFVKVEHIFDNLSKITNYLKTFSYSFVFKTNIDNNNQNNHPIFYTDSNGIEMVERIVDEFPFKKDFSKITSDNFYPVSSSISIQEHENNNNRVTVFNDRPQGGSGILSGSIILIMQKFSITSDDKGMPEKLIEIESYSSNSFKVTHFIIFGTNINVDIDRQSKHYNFSKKNINLPNFIFNYFNSAVLLFKFNKNYLDVNDRMIKENNLINNNFYQYIKVSDNIITHFQIINEKLIIGEYYKTYNDYYFSLGNDDQSLGIISLRFPDQSNFKIMYDRKGINYNLLHGNKILNEEQIKNLKTPKNIDLYLKNNEIFYIYYYFN